MTLSTLQQLDALQSSYVEAVNEAVAQDDCPQVRRLVSAYDADAARLLGTALGLAEVTPARTEVTPARTGGIRRIVSHLRRAA